MNVFFMFKSRSNTLLAVSCRVAPCKLPSHRIDRSGACQGTIEDIMRVWLRKRTLLVVGSCGNYGRSLVRLYMVSKRDGAAGELYS